LEISSVDNDQVCGILFYKNLLGEPAKDNIIAGYKLQQDKGRSGFGFVEVIKDKVRLGRYVYESDAMNKLNISKSTEILFHHRIPTSTINSAISNHPIFTDSSAYKYNYHFVHNGGISNDKELKQKHEDLGIGYSSVHNDGTFNDSEALMHELIAVIEKINEPKEFDARGTIAFVMIQTEKAPSNKVVALYYGRNNGSPLMVTKTKDEIIIRSRNAKADVEPNKLFKYNYKTRKHTFRKVEFGDWFRDKLSKEIKRVDDKKEQDGRKDEIEGAIERLYGGEKALVNEIPDVSEVLKIMTANLRIPYDKIVDMSSEQILMFVQLTRKRIPQLQIDYETAVMNNNNTEMFKLTWAIEGHVENNKMLTARYLTVNKK